MKIPMYQVDAFTDKLFKGNPAAVCLLEHWITDELMQKIAVENALSETAFCVKNGEIFELRWLTPEYEIDLCGHATLATAYVIFEHTGYKEPVIHFQTQSGILKVQKEGTRYSMLLPAREGIPTVPSQAVIDAVGTNPKEAYKARDLMLIFDSEQQVKDCCPDFEKLKVTGEFGVIITARGEHADFVSRYFAPGCSVMEDPVTGSAHCTLVPYWSNVLGKNKLLAQQLSARGGVLSCENLGSVVKVSGSAVLFFQTELSF